MLFTQVSEASPYGVYRIQSLNTNTQYHLVVTEDASILAPGAFLMEIPNYCGNPRLSEPPNTHIPFLKPYWSPERLQLSSRGNIGPFMNSVFVQFNSANMNEISGRFTTTNLNFLPARDGNDLRPTQFTGGRIDIEQDIIRLAESSIVNSEAADEAAGVFQGSLADGTALSLVLNRNTNASSENWDGTFRFGAHEGIAMGGSAAAKGVIRMVRAPGADTRVTSGITGTVVHNGRGGVEFIGHYFVIRTGCIMSLRMTKTARVLSR
jgi:hypothetical protein